MTVKRVVIGLVVLAVLGGAALFILDRTVFAPVAVSNAVPVAPTLAAQPATGAQPAASSNANATPVSAGDQQVYKIDPAQSEVHYEVNETIFQGNRLNTAIGRTKGIAGEIRVDFAQPSRSQIGDIVIDVSQFASDESRRDNFIRHTGLQSSTYPQATFKTTSITGLPDKVSVGDELSFKITGDLTVKQTTKPVTWDVKLTVGDKQLTGSASTQVLMSDFGVGPLKLPILATEDQVKLVFDIVALPVQS